MMKKNHVFSFLASFVIHLLILVAVAFAVFKKSEIPQVTAIDFVMLDKAKKEKKLGESSNLKKHQTENRQEHHHLEGGDSKAEAQKTVPVFNPLPQIPAELRDEAFVSDAVARFYVDAAGNVTRVELIKPCSNPRLNNLLLKSLHAWKFSAANKDSTQDIRVNFKVE